MLTSKPWKLDVILRLFLGVFVCYYTGSVAAVTVRFFQTRHGGGAQFYLAAAGAFVCLGATLLQLRRSWRLEELMKRLGFLLGTFYTGLILGTWAYKMAGVGAGSSVMQLLISSLSFQGAALVLVAFFLREHGVTWREAFGFEQQAGGAILRGVTAACVFLPIAMVLQWASARLMMSLPFWPIKPEEQEAVQTLQTAHTLLARTALGFVTILLVPPAEEILFRGILYPAIKQAGWPRLALWGTSLFFAAVHMNLVSFLPLLIFAAVLVALYEWTNNLLAPISAHACFNGLNFFMLYLLQEKITHLR